LAAKSALAIRYDALMGITTRSGDSANVEIDEEMQADGPTVGIKYREKVESRLRILEGRLDGTTVRSATKQQKKFEFSTYQFLDSRLTIVLRRIMLMLTFL